MTRPAHKRTYLDPIHQDIVLDRDKPAEQLIMNLVDTEEFQRLRRVHQLGVSYFTFQGAENSRFTHSFGVMHVASQLVNMISEREDGIEELRPLILASALLHDIGHGPYSHVTEKILHYDHEEWSCKIIAGDTGVRRVLEDFEPGFAEKIVKVLKKQYYPKYVSHIVSSQLDVDRFDYLLRDSYMTGTAYGLFALQRILRSLEIDKDNDRILVVGEKGQTAVEDYLFARYSMYAQVYYHRKNLAARALLNQLVNRARHLMRDGVGIKFIDGPTRKWLSGEELTVEEYTTLDDVQMTYHIKQWSKDPDAILADLASRFLHRRLPKATKIPFQDRGQIQALKEESRKVVAALGFDPDYYVNVESTGIRPYDYYRPDAAVPQTEIVVRTDTGEVNELSKLSPTIEALVKGNYESNWLCYPAEASNKISLIKEFTPVR
ncbi:MAG TPA: HD domain-containing protein [Drouetiella sp.]